MGKFVNFRDHQGITNCSGRPSDVSERDLVDLGLCFDQILRKIQKFDDPDITINRLVPLLVPLFWKNPTELDVTRFPDLISESGPPCQRFSRKNTHKTIRDVPVHTAVRPQTVTGGVMLRSLPLSCSAAAPSRQIDLTHSFLGVLRSWRALYPRKGPFAHDARKTSRC